MMAFAAAGDPNNETIPAWPACEPGQERTLVLDADTRTLTNYDHALMKGCAACREEIARKMSETAGQIQH